MPCRVTWILPLLTAAISFVLRSDSTAAEPATAPVLGLHENTPTLHALRNARIFAGPGKVIEKGTLVVRDGVITAVGPDVGIPAGATIWDLSGKTVYPGFIDAYGEQAVEAPKIADGAWNQHVVPQLRADEGFKPDAALNKKLRSQGFALRLVAPSGGIVKGTSTVVTTGDASPNFGIVRPQAAMHARLNPPGGGGPGGGPRQFPSSPMGAMTLVRQTLLDARWYAMVWEAYGRGGNVARPESNESLAALNDVLARKLPLFIDAPDILYFLRADAVGREFDLPVVVVGSGAEYQRLEAVRSSGRTVVVPLNFPQAPNVANAEAAGAVSLERLMHWDLAPENAGRLAGAGVPVALTTHGLKDVGGFWAALRKAMDRGLTQDQALKALTSTPAEVLGVADRYGSLAVGKSASFVIADGDLFRDAKAKLVETWVDGRRYEGQSPPFADLRGRWTFELKTFDAKAESVVIELAGTPEKLTGKLLRGKKETPLKNLNLDGAQWSASFKGDAIDWPHEGQLSATVLTAPRDVRDAPPGIVLDGFVVLGDGRRFTWKATHKPLPAEKDAKPAADDKKETAKSAEKPKAEAEKKTDADKKPEPEKKADAEKKPETKAALFPVNFPLGDYGVAKAPEQADVVAFVGATVWTSAEAGILEDAVVLVEKGKIKAVGKNVKVPAGAAVVNAKGMHLSPGIIDCHSHIATDGGINEATQSITAEVRIGDFIDPHDINLYRQLAGGVTAANILHGSANTIGGQNQVIKFRWGALPEEMKFAAAPPGIKFALGENVKQSNWPNASGRYPQSRMGVEQLLRDAFRAADDYRRRWTDYRRTKRGLPPRVDLEQEALVEVIEGKRLVHCHSYRQDEILAFLRVCEDHHVRVATLQHILEGYKVADVIAKHGAGGSSFADWWAYKFEVWDAIPYNGSLMHDAGVVVSFNSDDAELARRLNLEAAKAVKYGGVAPAEALKFVTLNPAKQLGIDRYVGSIEPGKDADLVLWSKSPLSSFTRCEQTWIDGRKYFDRVQDAERRAEVASQRNALIQRILASGAPQDAEDAKKSPGVARDDIYCSCRSPHARTVQSNRGE
jgi:imidazolonepropionase-like amidohydrolase